MSVAFSSRESLRSLRDSLNSLQWKIYETIRTWEDPKIGPSIRDLATRLGLETATVSGRVSELRSAGAIENGPLKVGTTGKRQISYIALEWREPVYEPGQLGLFL
jgi:DNA-binding MarR family transcriptional regulator